MKEFQKEKEPGFSDLSRILLSHEKEQSVPFAATWVLLEIIIPRDIGQGRDKQMPCDITSVWNLKYSTDEPIYRTEVGSQTWRWDWCLPKGEWRREKGVLKLGLADANITLRMEKQQGLTVQHRELYPVS